jgi:AraC-like DNA-binding protein
MDLDVPAPTLSLDSVLPEPKAAAHFETREVTHAVRQFTSVYGPHSLEVPHESPFEAHVRSFELAQLHVAHIKYGSEVVAAMSEPHPLWVFAYVRAGSTRSHTHAGPKDANIDDTFGAGSAGVNTPETVMDLAMSADAELVNLRVNAEDMRAACRALLGADHAEHLRFDMRALPGSDGVRTLTRVMKHLGDATRFVHPAARRFESTLRDAALYELLLGWPNSAMRASKHDEALPPSTRRARDYIHAHAAEVPTVAEIAAAAGVGVRALALGFERHFGMAPLRYLQQVRLDGVRAQLLTARGADTITRIALDWGFANAGMFAAKYRERFGESPSETLRRHLPR